MKRGRSAEPAGRAGQRDRSGTSSGLVRAAKRLGLQRRESTPFGVRWWLDVAAFIPNPKNVFDVGANVGQTVEVLLRQFPNTRIFAFEPVRATYTVLQQRTAQFSLVISNEFGLSDHSCTADMAVSGTDERNSLTLRGKPGWDTATVALGTVDEYLDGQHLSHLDLLKIDTEGHELNVLNGAARALGEHRIDMVLAECDFIDRPTDTHTRFPQLFDLLNSYGYTVVAFYTNRVDDRGWVWGDVLFKGPTLGAPTTHRRPLLPVRFVKPVLPPL